MMDIVLVDDETPILEWLTYCIEREGGAFRIVGRAKNGDEAYRLILETKPHVVISDIRMPGMDGLELLKQVKQVLPYTQFIILSNYADFSYAKQAIRHDAAEYLLKSELRHSELIAILRGMLEKMEQITRGKRGNVLSDGFVDLYALFQNVDDADFVAEFCRNIGMSPDRPYCMIVFERVDSDAAMQKIREIAETEPGALFMRVAQRKTKRFWILQGDASAIRRSGMPERCAEALSAVLEGPVVLSEIYTRLAEFRTAVEHARLTLKAGVLTGKSGVILEEEAMRGPRMERAEALRAYRQIVLLLNRKNLSEAAAETDAWFGALAAAHPLDAAWLEEMCITLTAAVEAAVAAPALAERQEGRAEKRTYAAYRQECLQMLDSACTGSSREVSETMQQALAYIRSHFSEEISLTDVAKCVYRSPEYFSRLFKEEMGTNFSTYLMTLRLSRAELLLRGGGRNVADVAAEVGYPNVSYFSRIYKKYIGVSPSEDIGKGKQER